MSLTDLFTQTSVAPTATIQAALPAAPSALIADAPAIPPATLLPAASSPDRQAAYQIIDRLMSFCGIEETSDLP